MANKLMAQLVVEPVVWDLPGPWAKVTGESSRVTFLNSTRFSNRMVNVELRLNTDPKIFISSTINGWQPLQIPTCHKLWTYYVIFTSIVTFFFFFLHLSYTTFACLLLFLFSLLFCVLWHMWVEERDGEWEDIQRSVRLVCLLTVAACCTILWNEKMLKEYDKNIHCVVALYATISEFSNISGSVLFRDSLLNSSVKYSSSNPPLL